MRLDRLLWFLRFARTRSAAQRWIAEGHIRRNGERVVRQLALRDQEPERLFAHEGRGPVQLRRIEQALRAGRRFGRSRDGVHGGPVVLDRRSVAPAVDSVLPQP